ncbi:flagellar hook-basal body protein [Paenibacillus thermoaerophilus]|uniref:Flagellar hook-basal body protein n=1 Tax=Paenibacillus thermoaerophilus TaxID=1215385 RepID=A0ABW2V8R7_9BACL|nr:flagellar hook-basal body protein [Paenibacillus thermoaerophilus]TMV12502.1 flagellar hook-basal body protein [Paenibacillus thermoaerophilus]
MIRGLYTATAGMITSERKHQLVTNNIANLNTVGFKASHAVARSFPEVLIGIINGGEGQAQGQPIGRLHTGVFAEESLNLHVQGDLRATGNPTDFAIRSNIQVPGVQFDASGKGVNAAGETVYQPQAFFAVRNGEGQVRYTRDGQFIVDDAGRLLTSEGYEVLGLNNEPIVFGADTAPGAVAVGPDGRFVSAVTGAPLLGADGQALGGLLVVRIDNPYMLIREGNGVFRLEEGADAVPVTAQDAVEVKQGYLERSNVDAAQSMVDLMAAVRAYEANQKVVQAYDRSLEKAVNEVGKV